MEPATQKNLDALRAKWGERFDIWYVPTAIAGIKWYALPHGGWPSQVIKAGSPQELDAALETRSERRPPRS